ncbi:MAG: Hpt domain-containing protein [Boseongicola sp.]
MIDWNRLSELRSEVGEDDYDEILVLFFDEVASVLDSIESANVDAMKRDLHFLKGSAMNIGLTDVSALCQDYELALATNPDDTIDLSAIRHAFLASKEKIESRAM